SRPIRRASDPRRDRCGAAGDTGGVNARASAAAASQRSEGELGALREVQRRECARDELQYEHYAAVDWRDGLPVLQLAGSYRHAVVPRQRDDAPEEGTAGSGEAGRPALGVAQEDVRTTAAGRCV